MQRFETGETAQLILLHGLLSTPREFGLITGRLRAQGVPLCAPAIPRYTLARGARTSWRAWVASAAGAIGAARDRRRACVVGGLCTGGLIAAALALDAGARIDGLVLLAPSIEYDGWGLPALTRLRRLGYWLGLDGVIRVPEREPYGIKNAAVRSWVVREMRQHSVSSAGPAALPLWALRESERLTAFVRQRVRQLQLPVLIVHAAEDEITTLAPVRRFFDALACDDKRLCVLDDSYHVITLDNERARVAAEVARFARHVGARAAARARERWRIAG